MIPATYCTVIFALVGVSVLEAMVVSFLIGLDGYSGKEAQSFGNTHMDIQLEATYHKGNKTVHSTYFFKRISDFPLKSVSADCLHGQKNILWVIF